LTEPSYHTNFTMSSVLERNNLFWCVATLKILLYTRGVK